MNPRCALGVYGSAFVLLSSLVACTGDASDSADTQDASGPNDSGSTLDGMDDADSSSVPDLVSDADEICPTTDPAAEEIGYPPTLELLWSRRLEYGSFSSPVVTDLNQDCRREIILGQGQELGTGQGGSLSVFDAESGEDVWRASLPQEIYTSAVLVELNGDAFQEIVVGGRFGMLTALDGATGNVLWQIDPRAEGFPDTIFNFYTPQLLPDVTDDGRQDLLVAYGGDATRQAFEPRLPGWLYAIDSTSGEVVLSMQMPDGAETYMSPVILERPGQPTLILFGTGGETHAGSLWAIEQDAFIEGRTGEVIELVAPTTTKGVMAPPSLADFDGDGTLDVVVATFDGRAILLDGRALTQRWTVRFENAETYASPAIGYLDADTIPDVFVAYNYGEWAEGYTGSEAVAIQGGTGQVFWRAISDGIISASPVAVDLNEDGPMEIIYFESKETGTSIQVVSPLSGQVDFLTSFPGVSLYSTPRLTDVEGDGVLDMVVPFYVGLAPPRSQLELRVYSVHTPASALREAWPGYLGSDGRSIWGRSR